jgi:4-hydroxy-4-methyl-2-oxoglutarate aldolase
MLMFSTTSFKERLINMSTQNSNYPISHGELLELRRWNTPTIYNGWEQITKHDSSKDAFNLEDVHDYMPEMGVMVGYAITVVCEPSNGEHPRQLPDGWNQYREYVASIPGPKIVIVQDLDKPNAVGAFWGEVNANMHRALGCVGTIIDGAIRDVDEMKYAGFKALARRMCVGHAHSWPVRWGSPVEVFGRRIEPGQLIHADKHGFMAIPFGDEKNLLEAARFMDTCESQTMIAASRETAGMSIEKAVKHLNQSVKDFGIAVKEKFNRRGEF